MSRFNRVGRTRPEQDVGASQFGVGFVDILFGLVVTTAVEPLAQAGAGLLQRPQSDVSETRLAHLALAFVVSLSSWIGYHQSKQYPKFAIKLVNLPLVMFGLDVAMVVTYYVIVATAEPVGASADARPEFVLVGFVFVLYSVWDLLGWRVWGDPAYALVLQRSAEKQVGPRRKVTFASTAIVVVSSVFVWRDHPQSPRVVIALDAGLVLLAVIYRLTKQLVDPDVLVRHAEA